MAGVFKAYEAQQTAVDAIISWSPLLWGMRIVALLVVGGSGIVVLALIIRLLSPSNLRGLMRGDLPGIRKGRFNVMGQEIEISTTTDSRRDYQVAELDKQVKAAHDVIDKLIAIVDVSAGGGIGGDT